MWFSWCTYSHIPEKFPALSMFSFFFTLNTRALWPFHLEKIVLDYLFVENKCSIKNFRHLFGLLDGDSESGLRSATTQTRRELYSGY